MRLLEQTPDLGRCWVRYRFRRWPGDGGLWLDLFSRGLGGAAEGVFEVGDLDRKPDLNDIVYLPPVDRERQAFRLEVATKLAENGAPVLMQSLPGGEARSPGAEEVIDVLSTVVTGNLVGLKDLTAGSKVIWPLISGYSDEADQWDEGLEYLAASGATHVQGITADLSPADRRRLVEAAGDVGFEKLFHGPAPSEREFAIRVSQRGMKAFLGRPLPPGPPRLAGNRRLAGTLASIGELWLRVGRSESRGQMYYRAARWVDRDNHDLITLAREGNLGVVTWLDGDSRQVIEEVAEKNESLLLQELLQEYLTPEEP